MQTVVWEFDSERAMEEAMHHLWERLGITGEMLTQRLSEGCWRLELVAEQTVRSATLEKIGGRLVKS